MFSKKKPNSAIDKDQLELIENAQKRIIQKKRLYIHFVIFLIGSIFLIVLNLVLGYGSDFKPFNTEWFVWAILIWLFLLLYHVFNVFITHNFMGKAWEKQQLEKLVSEQKRRIEKLKASLPQESARLKSSDVPNKLESGKKKTELTLIAAAGENNAIGKDNKLIWHLGDDLKHFKNLTNGHHIIMGRKTFESFPKPLPNRTHVVITKQDNYKVPDGVIVVNSLEDAIDASKDSRQIFIIGGGEIYKQAISIADKIELTRVHEDFEADTFFPLIDNEIWKETSNTYFEKDENNDHDFSLITYTRK